MSKKRTVVSYDTPPDYTIKLENRLQPRTEGHRNYIRTMVENDVTVVVGPPGSSKSFSAIGLACEYLSRGEVEKLIFSRPIIQCGKDLGAAPGTISEKVLPYFYPVLDCLDYFLGNNKYKGLIGSKKIEFIPLEVMRGMSIKNTFVVLDEASNAQLNQLKMFLSRIDIGSKFVLNGDYRQCDIKYCDFYRVVEQLKTSHIPGLGFCELTKKDVCRPKIVNDMMDEIERIEF